MKGSLASDQPDQFNQMDAQWVRVLIDVRSTHSDGKHDMETLIRLAEQRGIKALFFTEHDRVSIRFGIAPIENILGYSVQHPSLYTTGLEYFFSDLHAHGLKHPEIQLLAGTESMSGYTWSGIPFKSLRLNNAERHMITLGIEKPEQVEGISSYDLRHAHAHQGFSLAFWCFLFVFAGFLLIYQGKRKMALLLSLLFVFFLATWFAKEHGDPDTDFIQSAHLQGLFVIWAHPGTQSGIRNGLMGVELHTPPYSQRVFKEPTADAFAAVYGDNDKNTVAGGLWDRYMLDYMHGKHEKPIWAVAAGDYHEEGMASEYLGNFPMDVWAKSNQQQDILAAMKQGQMVAWGMQKDQNISVRTLYLEDADGLRLLPGGEAHVRAPLHAYVELGELIQHSGVPAHIQAEWLIDGERINTVDLKASYQQDDAERPVIVLPVTKGAHVIRLQIKQGLRMVANPFLVYVE